MEGLDSLGIELSQRNEELQRAHKSNKDWKAWLEKASEKRKRMKEAFETRVEHLSHLLQGAQAHVLHETKLRQEAELAY